MRWRCVAVMVLLFLPLCGCDPSFQPRQLGKDDVKGGMPPLTGTLPNGVIGNSETK